jgi:hypothetical protein
VRPSVTHGLKEKTCQIAAGQRQIAGQFTNETGTSVNLQACELIDLFISESMYLYA